MRERFGSRPYDAALHMLDRQVLDPDGRMVGKVDDLELVELDDGRLAVAAILTGPGALGPRLKGHLGAWVVAVWARLDASEHPVPGRIEVQRVDAVDSAVHVDRTRDQLAIEGFERWVERRLIRPLPGSGHAPE